MSPLGVPPPSLAGFPTWQLPVEQALFRVHRRLRNPWYFDSGPHGRFNLSEPRGTCYLAKTAVGAFLETLGRQGRLIPQAEADARVLSTLRVPRPLAIADCIAARARAFGITVGIHALEDYTRTRQWALAFAEAGFDGVRYRASHDPRARSIGIAVFGPTGEGNWPFPPPAPIPRALIARVERTYHVLVVPTP